MERSFYNEIEKFCELYNCSIFHFLNGVLATYFSRIFNKESIVIGVPLLNRRNVKFKSTIGHFANVIPLIINIYENQSFVDMIQSIRDGLKEGYRHHRLSLGQILNEVDADFDRKKDVFEITLSYEKHVHDKCFCGFEAETVALDHRSEIAALSVHVREFSNEDDVRIDFYYQHEVFNNNFPIQNVVVHINNLLHEAVRNASKDILTLEYLSQEEKKKIIGSFNDTKAAYPMAKTIHQLFEEQAERTPNNIALVYEDKQITYKELNEKSNQLARFLREKGVKPDSIVGIMVERSVEMIVGMMAVLKAGGAYLPIDPLYPKERIKYMLDDSGAKVLLIQHGLHDIHNNIVSDEVEVFKYRQFRNIFKRSNRSRKIRRIQETCHI